MANAAAKKAAAAKKSAASTYFPIVVGLNAGYLFLRLVYQWNSLTVLGGLATGALLLGSALSYKGILEDHANAIPKRVGESQALAGGISLDFLGLIVLVQYGTVLVSEKFYWLLVLVPLWGGWKIYSTFFGAKGGSGDKPAKQLENFDGANDDEATQKANAKRQKRAERRRQKWA